MATPRFDRDRAIRILVDALDMGDAKACARHNVTVRTLQNYRKRMVNDPELSQAFALKKEQVDRKWDTQRRLFLAEGFAKVRELISTATLTNLRDLVGALKVAGELQVTTEALDVGARTDRESQAAPEDSRRPQSVDGASTAVCLQ